MEQNKYLISICIPSYNGEDTISETLDSLVREIGNLTNIEIVINDDKSTDKTFDIAKEYMNKYDYISIYKNEENLRMDRNFTAVALKANSKYVWFCGQDDIFQNGAISKAITIIQNHEDINFIYFNYKFVDDDLINEVMPPILKIKEDKYFKNDKYFFKIIKFAPTFLPANVMKREFWMNNIAKYYFDTYYVQVGVWLEYSANGNIYTVADKNYILCRVPRESWKYNNGKMLFGTELGKLKVYKIALDRNKIIYSTYNNMKNTYLSRTYLNTIASKAKGLIVDKQNILDLKYIFNKDISSYIKVRFITLMPTSIAKVIYIVGRKLRESYKNW